MSELRLCLFEWSDRDKEVGSNHACGEERGHAGDHDCLTCHAQHPADEVVAAPAYGVHA